MKLITVLTAALAAAFVAACGGGSGSGNSSSSSGSTGGVVAAGSSASAPSVKDRILALEAAGKLPTLDRSSSLNGPDVNTNGVRDDIDTYLGAQSYTGPQLQAVRQTAKALAAILRVDPLDQDALRASDLSLQKSIRCVYSRFPEGDQASIVIKTLEKMTANTKARVEAYIKYQTAMNGKVFASPQGDSCE
jgi:hypothetical protein